MAVICRDIGFLFLQAPHTGSSAIGRALRTQRACIRLVHDHARDDTGRIIMRKKHQTLSELLATSTITADERANLFVAAGVRNPFDLVVTEYARGIDLDAPDTPRSGGTWRPVYLTRRQRTSSGSCVAVTHPAWPSGRRSGGAAAFQATTPKEWTS